MNFTSSKKRGALIGVVLSVCIFWSSVSVYAQNKPVDQADVETEMEKPSPDAATYETLGAILETVDTLEQELDGLKMKLPEATTEEQKQSIKEKINQVTDQKEGLVNDFEKITTGVDLSSMAGEPKKSFDIKEEIQDLLTPIIQELKNVTKTPRAVEKLRRDVQFYEERLETIRQSLENIRNLLRGAKRSDVRRKLEEMEQRWSNRERQIQNQLTVANYQLEEKTKNKTTLVESSRNFVRIFFKSRGRNLILSIAAFIGVFFMMRLGYRLILMLQKEKTPESKTFYTRLLNVGYYFLTFLMSFGAFMGVLYISGDWLLLSLAIIFLLGLVWTAKEGLPRFWEQIKFMLNLGTVKENQRLIYNGVPWKVVSLNLYSKLENPDLTAGKIHLPIRHLTGMVSRPSADEEPWFPTKKDDWVILSDGTHGKVVVQTPEMVMLELRGGAIKTYMTSDFLAMNPTNISVTFRIETTFGIDYAHQAECTTRIPEAMLEDIEQGLENDGHSKYLLETRVEFKTAGLSSLDYEIIAYFEGGAAPFYDILSRAVQRYAVDACNRRGWLIPFTQVTLHTAGDRNTGLNDTEA